MYWIDINILIGQQSTKCHLLAFLCAAGIVGFSGTDVDCQDAISREVVCRSYLRRRIPAEPVQVDAKSPIETFSRTLQENTNGTDTGADSSGSGPIDPAQDLWPLHWWGMGRKQQW